MKNQALLLPNLLLIASGLLLSFSVPIDEHPFKEDFDDNRHSWTPVNEDAKKMNINSGWLWLPTRKYSAEVYCGIEEPVQLDRNFEISFAIKATKADDNEYFGIELMGSKFIKELHTNKLIIKLTTGGKLKLSQRLDDLKYPANEHISPTAINKGEGAVNTLKLTRLDEVMKLEVNGKTVLEDIPFSIENPTKSFHRVAVQASGDKMNVAVDYIYIKYLP